MKKKVLIVSVSVLVIVVVWLVFFRSKANAPGSQIMADRALNVIDSLQAGDYKKATRDFDDQIVPIFIRKLPEVWPTVMAKAGPLKARTVERMKGNKVYITCTFERGTLWGVVEFDGANKIVNFSMYGHPV